VIFGSDQSDKRLPSGFGIGQPRRQRVDFILKSIQLVRGSGHGGDASHLKLRVGERLGPGNRSTLRCAVISSPDAEGVLFSGNCHVAGGGVFGGKAHG
jgi:hypothetical protein